MNTLSMENGKQEQVNDIEKEKIIEYEYAGYQIRVHFSNEKTLLQCMKNLAERRNKQ